MHCVKLDAFMFLQEQFLAVRNQMCGTLSCQYLPFVIVEIALQKSLTDFRVIYRFFERNLSLTDIN